LADPVPPDGWHAALRGKALEQDSLVDGSIPTTTEARHGESREYANRRGFAVAPGEAKVPRGCATVHVAQAGAGRARHHPNDLYRESHRVYLMAPARWRSAVSTARSRTIDWATVLPQARRPGSPAAPLPLPMNAPPERAWLLPPAWPLDGWRVPTIDDTRIVPWARARMNSWLARASTSRYRFTAAIAGSVLVSLGVGMLHGGRQSAPASAPAVVSARPAPAVFLPPLPRRPAAVAVVAAPVPASVSTASSSDRSRPVESDRRLLSDVSTMDLMMPIAEPDLDIGSGQSLWSQVGKAAGVDPLLLYSIALVESKALYPDGKVAPTPWLFRVNDHLVRGERHDVQLAMAAASQFDSAVQDVGIMQVYYPMHRDAVRDPLTLLNPHTNISVAAKILRDGMHQTRDPVLGVGYYHSHTPSLARDYGTAVLTVYQRLKAIHRSTARRSVVTR
jgi:hypothetical protein